MYVLKTRRGKRLNLDIEIVHYLVLFCYLHNERRAWYGGVGPRDINGVLPGISWIVAGQDGAVAVWMVTHVQLERTLGTTDRDLQLSIASFSRFDREVPLLSHVASLKTRPVCPNLVRFRR